MDVETLTREFVSHARAVLRQHQQQIVRCIDLLDDGELWHRDNDHCNSVANLVLHLTGNVRQWVVGGIGGGRVFRDRPAEFAARRNVPRGQLRDDFLAAMGEADAILERVDAAVLARPHTIQAYEVSGLVAIFHVTEHFSGHTGQIVHICKRLKGVDLSLYDAQGRKAVGEPSRP